MVPAPTMMTSACLRSDLKTRWSAGLAIDLLDPSPPLAAPSAVATKFSRSHGSRGGEYAARSASSSRSASRSNEVTPLSCRCPDAGDTPLRAAPRLRAVISLEDLATLRDDYAADLSLPVTP